MASYSLPIYSFFLLFVACVAGAWLWEISYKTEAQNGANMRVVAVDVGILHLALVDATLGRHVVDTIHSVHLVNLTTLPHARVAADACGLYHTKELGDRLAHFKQEYGHILDRADAVLVERQPITGLQSVQLFFHQTYRHKVHLLSPNSMHKFYNLSRSYQHRKVQVVAIMRNICQQRGFAIEAACASMPRLHDVADALLFAWWFGFQRRVRASPYFDVPKVVRPLPHLRAFAARRQAQRTDVLTPQKRVVPGCVALPWVPLARSTR